MFFVGGGRKSFNLEHYSMWKARNRGNAVCETHALRGNGDI